MDCTVLDPITEELPLTQTAVTYDPVDGAVHIVLTVLEPNPEILPATHALVT